MSHYGGGGYGGDRGRYDDRRGSGGGSGGGYHQDRGRQQFRGGGGGGYGGDHRDRSHSRGGGNIREIRGSLERDGFFVKTNYFRLTLTERGDQEWYSYHLQISPARRVPKRITKIVDGNETVEKELDQDGKPIFEVVPARGKDFFSSPNKEETKWDKSSILTRRVLNKLKVNLQNRDPPKHLFTDGTRNGFSPKPLFDHSMDPMQMEAEDPSSRKASYYGPQQGDDDEEKRQEAIKSSTGDYYLEEVRVKAETDEDDPEAEGTKSRWFLVKITFLSTVTFCHDLRERLLDENSDRPLQCINVALKNAMMAKMMSFERSPRMFCFKADPEIRNLLGNAFSRFNFNPDYAPLVGLMQVARMTGNGDVFVAADFGVKWMRPEKGQNNENIRLLRQDSRSGWWYVAGVEIRDPNRPIQDENVRSELERALRKISFHCRYRCGDRWVEEMRARGKDEDWIKKRRTRIRKNLRLWKPPKEIARPRGDDGKGEGDKPEENKEFDRDVIKWEPDKHTFVVRERGQQNAAAAAASEASAPPDEKRQTVAEYFRERYDIVLRFPHMPLVRTSKIDFFPIEFLAQAMGEYRNANSDDHKRLVLAVNDEFSGDDRINQTQKLLLGKDARSPASGPSALAEEQRQLLRLMNLRLEEDPLTLKAKVLHEPVLSFARNTPVDINDGAWNMRNVTFNRPADLLSFAVIDLDGVSFSRIFPDLLKQLKIHRFRLPRHVDPENILRDVAVSDRMDRRNFLPQLERCFQQAVQKARSAFIQPRDNVFFETIVRNTDTGELSQCLVFPIDDRTVGGILPRETFRYTHKVTNPATNETYDARLAYRAFRDDRDFFYADAFDVRRVHQDGSRTVEELRARNEEANDNNNWERVRRVEVVYEVELGGETRYVTEDEVSRAEEIISFNINDVECPSVVFVCMPDKTTKEYNLVKLFSNVMYGVQSQVVCASTYNRQRGKDQYCANIALKLNTKLANHLNGALAWGCRSSQQEGLPWVSEVPTLIMGYSLASGQGQDKQMVVVGAGCLDHFGMQMCREIIVQKKTPMVPKQVLIGIVQSIAVQFYKKTDALPLRVVIYRQGGNDGDFEKIIAQEIGAIRTAFFQLGQLVENCCQSGCHLCTPVITLVVAQTEHSIKIVPDGRNDRWPRNKKNVPSGLCLDDPKALLKTGVEGKNERRDVPATDGEVLRLFEVDDEKKFEFFLTAHGGLKGTSKPVYYRAIWNENYWVRPRQGPGTQLTKDALERLTFAMCFSYGSATKVPRVVPVLKYCQKTANTVLGYLGEAGLREERPAVGDDDNEEDNEGVTIYRRQEGDDPRLLANFSACGSANPLDNREWRLPFRPHLDA